MILRKHRHKLVFISMCIALLLLLTGCARTCEIEGCNDEVDNPKLEKSKYCYIHTCIEDNCWNKVFFPPKNVEYSFASGHDWYCDKHIDYLFDISNVKLDVNNSIATISGAITNVSKQDYRAVYIDGNFFTSDGSEHVSTYIRDLNSGDTTNFEISTKVTHSVKSGSVTLDEAWAVGGKWSFKLKDYRSWHTEYK